MKNMRHYSIVNTTTVHLELIRNKRVTSFGNVNLDIETLSN